jgi:thiamine biosynthesis lipoprotein
MNGSGKNHPDRREFLALGVGALAVATLPRALRRRRDRLIRRQIPVMGTIADIAVRSDKDGWAEKGIDAAIAELRRVDRTMSRFRSDSEVGRANLEAAHHAVPVGEDTATVLLHALHWARASNGRFDPGLGKATALWDVEDRKTPPPAAEVRPFAGRHFYQDMDVDLDGSVPRVRFASPAVAIDLGGIAKGYGVDLAVRAMRDMGIENALVNCGGDLVAIGVDDEGKPWKIGVRSPFHVDQVAQVLRVSDRAVATSGTYFRYFRYDGRVYSHLLDPRDGSPRETRMESLSVEADHCMAADAAATALFGARGEAWKPVLDRAAPGARVVSVI